MTGKEKAADAYVRKLFLKPRTDEVCFELFLAGCTYQEQVDREVIERLELTITKIDDHIRLMRVEGVIDMKEMCRALKVISDVYHKATGQAEKE